jgi:hypothetical protein
MRLRFLAPLFAVAALLALPGTAHADYGAMSKPIYSTIFQGELQDNVEISCACGGHKIDGGTFQGGEWKLTSYPALNSSWPNHDVDRVYVWFNQFNGSSAWHADMKCLVSNQKGIIGDCDQL